MANDSGDDDLQAIGFQLAMAFGQGAGTMLATSRALQAAFKPYDSAVRNRLGNWADAELRAVAFARALGHVAAVHAAGRGHCVIDVEDVEYGLDAVRRNELRPLGACDLTDRRANKPVGPVV